MYIMTVQLNNNSHLLVMEIPESRCIVGYLNISCSTCKHDRVDKNCMYPILFHSVGRCLGIRSHIIFAPKFVAKNDIVVD